MTMLELFIGSWLICIVVIFIINILLLIWVYKDAQKRGANPVLWLIVVLIAGILGLIIWLIVRPKMH